MRKSRNFFFNCNNFCCFVVAILVLHWGLPLHSIRWSCLEAHTEKKKVFFKRKSKIEHFRLMFFSCIKLAKLSAHKTWQKRHDLFTSVIRWLNFPIEEFSGTVFENYAFEFFWISVFFTNFCLIKIDYFWHFYWKCKSCSLRSQC